MENMNHWFQGIKGKLLFLALLPIAILGLTSSIALKGISDLSETIEEASTVRAPKIRAVGQMDSAKNGMFRWLWASYINQSDAAGRTRTLEKAKLEIKRFEESRKIYAALPKVERAKQDYRIIEENWVKAQALTNDAILLLEKNDSANNKQIYAILTEHLRPSLEPISTAFDDLSAFTDEQIQENLLKTRQLITTIRQLALGMSVLGAIALLVICTFVASKLAGALTLLTSRLAESGSQVSTASMQLSAASQQLSSGATEAASSLEETVSSIEELSSMVKLNADHASEAASLSLSGRRSAEEGEQEMKQLTLAMSGIAQSSKRIEEIINVIDDIAFQTNILALNAAVEAARAGEQGKGFAVVAEAVRTLAQRSGAAAKEITTLIKESVNQVENGSKVADRSGIVLNGIVTSIKKIADLNGDIASACQEQSSGLAQISKAMNQLDQATQGNAASAEEAAAASEEMAAQAQALKAVMTELSGIVYGQRKDLHHSQAPGTHPVHSQSPSLKVVDSRHSGIATFANRKGQLKRVGGESHSIKAVRSSDSKKNRVDEEFPMEDSLDNGKIASNF